MILSRFTFIVTLLAFTLGRCAAVSVTSQTQTFSPGFPGELEKLAASHRGNVGIFLHHLEKKETIRINADQQFPTASTIKVPVMCAALDLLANGTGPYKSYYDTRKYDASTSVSGSGIIRNFKDGTPVELKELIHLMITVSDNVGTNMLVEWIGIDTVNNWLIKHNFQHTRLFSTIGGSMIYDAEGSETWGLGRTTPEEMGRLMEMIVTGKAGTTSTTDEMLRVMGHQYFDGGIAGGLPPTVYAGTKSGALNRHRSDNGIVVSCTGTYVISIYTNDNADARWGKENEADQFITKVSNLVWNHFNPESPWKPAAGAENF